jgi:protease-4
MSDNTNDKVDGGVAGSGGAPAGNWERDVLEKLVFATLQEQRAHRRWGIFFKVFSLLIVLFALWVFYDYNSADDGETAGPPHGADRHRGSIESEGSGSAAVVIPALDKAFSDAGSVAVVLHINSPAAARAGRHDRRRDAAPAQGLSGQAAICGGR